MSEESLILFAHIFVFWSDIMKRDFYIYNPVQANFFLQKGLVPVEIGIGKKNKKVFIKFIRDENSQIVFDEWCKLCALQNEYASVPDLQSNLQNGYASVPKM
jgi:hypothetical protein